MSSPPVSVRHAIHLDMVNLELMPRRARLGKGPGCRVDIHPGHRGTSELCWCTSVGGSVGRGMHIPLHGWHQLCSD